ncbi:YcaO-like family protein [Streptomyces sp. RPT161]|uniref:YcaO-like family protein n=1 Tax=Streptomyces sp. RPT161 TaxID=3015993 RepID=UPI0022B8DE1E|nr:YcaO-like family protein [Streptomyces sp. RPT161]
MIDYLATIAPATGVVRGSTVLPPSMPTEPLWRGMMELAWDAGPAPADRPLAANVVGAYGVSRSDVFVRAIGEAVERYALRPAPTDDPLHATHAALGAPTLDFGHHETSMGEPTVASCELAWYPARRLSDGVTVRVPAGLVDFPASDADAVGFDPSPSGAASGPGHQAALRSALLETIERDAVLVAWARRLELPRVDLGSTLAQLPPSPSLTRLRRALDRAGGAGCEPILAQVPTGVPGVVCAVGIIVDGAQDDARRHPSAAVGCKASTDPAAALAGALQEALQIHSVLRVVRHRLPDAPAPDPTAITDDVARALYFASGEGVAAVDRWTSCFGEPVPLRPPGGGEEATLTELIDSVHADGGRPLVVDLSHRLPDPLRQMGWAVVKVIPDGYQPLLVNEQRAFVWNRPRLATATHRTGLTAHAAVTDAIPPHPLI